MNAVTHRAMNQYKQVGTQINADSADPHQLIVMLFDGALERIAIAKGAIFRQDIAEKGQKIGRAIAIIDGLRASLDKDNGGEIAENLDDLYDYMQRRLLDANINSDVEILDEVTGLIKDVREAWVAIPLQDRYVGN
ncbi:flagellar export chaperone FliS [Methylobacter marinus]|jgi:flagellar secretion chaperone FliS|uniref:flagellar export chaperone FliS n=1 Tax=Methylobacter marinus TaxID=34058 RepID=UPI0003A7722F|nr:flagellar export chaperone FliS [Methylobacter marinus]